MGKTGWAQGQIRDPRGVILPCGAPNCFAHSRADCELTHKLFRRAIKKITTRYLAEKAGLVTVYDSAYKMLCASVHVDVRYLQRKLNINTDNNISGLLWGPDTKGLGLILLTAADTILSLLIGVQDVFVISPPQDYADFKEKVQQLAEHKL